MRDQALFDKIDLHLIRVLHTVLTERSVSRAAIRLGMYQPAVSAALKRLRDLAGDPLLVRSGAGMVPTAAGLRMIEPSASILRAAEVLFTDARGFEPQTTRNTFRAPAPPGAKSVIARHLDSLGLRGNIPVRCPHFGLIPGMVGRSLLVLTTGRQYCERYSEDHGGRLPVKILECPIEFPKLVYYQLWHERTHASNSAKWLRERVKSVAATLRKE